MPLSHDARVVSDAAFLGLHQIDGPEHLRFTVASHLSRHDARLYGGSAVAVSVAAAEQLSARNALWMTTQFVSTAAQGTEVDVLVEVLAPGKRTNQVRVTGTTADGVVFASLGATGQYRDGGITGEFESRPTVTWPDDVPGLGSPMAVMRHEFGGDFPEAPPGPSSDTGFGQVIELRPTVVLEHPDPGPGRMCMWVRRRDGHAITPAVAAYMADMIPMAIGRAAGELAVGTSLDNSIRIGSFVETEWILLDLRPHMAVGDYGHGTAHVWSQDGHLMATASQTASMFRLDPENAPWMKRA